MQLANKKNNYLMVQKKFVQLLDEDFDHLLGKLLVQQKPSEKKLGSKTPVKYFDSGTLKKDFLTTPT